MGGTFAQIGILLRKNFLLMWRSKVATLIELGIPLFLSVQVLLILKNMGRNYVEEAQRYEPWLITGNSADFDRPASIYNKSQKIWKKYAAVGYSSEPSIKNAVDELMRRVQLRFNEKEDQEMFLKFRPFPDLEQLKGNINGSEYFGGIYFNGVQSDEGGELEPKLDFRFLVSQYSGSWPLSSFWLGNDPFSQNWDDSSQLPTNPSYWISGFASIQHAIQMSFLEMAGKTFDQMDISLLRIPIIKNQSGYIFIFLQNMQINWAFTIMSIMLFLVKNVVIEKEAGIKTYMSVMGLNQMAFYYSHIIIAALKATIVLAICSVIVANHLSFISPTIFTILSILFAIAMIHLAALSTTLVRTHQMNQFLLSIFTLGLLVLATKANPSNSSIGLCLLASLNPIAAFRLGIDHIENYERKMTPFGLNALFSGADRQFTIGWAMLMLFFDSVLFSLLIGYIDAVMPVDDSPKKHPLFFLKCGFLQNNGRNYRVEDVQQPKQPKTEQNENMEKEEKSSANEANIDVRNMSKQWGSGKGAKLAVNDLSFRACRGKLTVLLGHNGAGKSTTFSILTGSVKCTSGQVLICGMDLAQNLRECQKKIGYCPQNNPLFERLTVKEHLYLYAGLKCGAMFSGSHEKSMLEKEISELLQSVGLAPKIDTWACQLSGGQKRKLCVAIAMIGQSQVVLLDEPTAGMDPEARADVGKLLREVKKDRTVLLTTHYMEEADALGDRIAIMVDGELKCAGSSEFLKNRFGAGFVLSVVTNCSDVPQTQQQSSSNANIEMSTFFNATIHRIISLIQKYSPNARVDRAQSPPEFSVILPTSDKRQFANLFEELEARKTELGIHSFGLSLNTLEQVFLKVGELSEKSTMTTNGEKQNSTKQTIQRITNDLFGPSRQREDFTKYGLFINQIGALLYRQALWAWRNPFRSFTPLILAILFFVSVGFIAKQDRPPSNQFRSLSMDEVQENVKIPLQIKANQFRSGFTGLTKKLCAKCKLIELSPKADLQSELELRQFDLPPPMMGGAAIGQSGNGIQIDVLFNPNALHSIPMALSFVANGLLGTKSFSIRSSIEIYDIPQNQMDIAEQILAYKEKFLSNGLVSMAIILCFSIFSATTIVPLVEEKAGKFKHQLMLTKLHISTYWCSVFVWNLLLYIAFCAVIIGFIFAFGWMQGGRAELLLLWALYFFSFVPMNAVLSFVFSSPQKAFSLLFAFNMVVSILLLILSMVLRLLRVGIWPDLIDTIGFIIAPTYALGAGVFQILLISLGIPRDMLGGLKQQQHIYMMALSGIIFTVLLIALESMWFTSMLKRCLFRIFHGQIYKRIINNELDEGEPAEDNDVRLERERVEIHGDNEFALAVRNLVKYYGKFPAVRGITFGVKQEECFGLLGVNGAGKTSTFDILTAENLATFGWAAVSGVDVKKSPPIGYCPQFDALPMEMTGREVLTLLGWLNGYSSVKKRVQKILWSVQMESEADRKVKEYSGGQKRRISVGTTLLTRSSLIMLDEPTAGIDPITRRQIWQLLLAVRQQRIAILLTSHSMDECEELCNKIGFLNRGKLVGMGSSQHLKSRFGNSYLLTITISNPNSAVFVYLNAQIVENFSALPCDDPATSAILQWEIPKRGNATNWSWLYSKAQKLADLYPDEANLLPPGNDRPKIVDFSLTQNSLEQVFLRLSKSTTMSQ